MEASTFSIIETYSELVYRAHKVHDFFKEPEFILNRRRRPSVADVPDISLISPDALISTVIGEVLWPSETRSRLRNNSNCEKIGRFRRGNDVRIKRTEIGRFE